MNIERIVIVDDERIIRESLRGWFLPTFEVFCFDSSERFLDSLNQFDFEDGNPTCMLLDFQMPGMNGVELQQTLKSLNVEFPHHIHERQCATGGHYRCMARWGSRLYSEAI